VSLRKTTLLIIAITFIVLLVSVWVVSQEIILRGFAQLETRDMEHDLARAEQALGTELERLQKLALDWAPWDDSYQFMLDENEDFVSANLVPNVFRDQELDILAFFALDGRLVWGQGFDRDRGMFSELPEGTAEAARRFLDAFESQSPPRGRRGLVRLPAGTLLASVEPILTSEGLGRHRGLLVMGRFFDEALVGQLESRTRLRIGFRPLDERPALGLTGTAGDGLQTGKRPDIRAMGADEVVGRALVRDIDGAPCLVLTVTTGREAYAQGLRTVRTALASLALAGLVCSLVLLVLFERRIAGPLRRLGRQVAYIGKSESLSLRVKPEGVRELAHLAGEFNGALDEIERSRQRLSAQLAAIEEQDAFLSGLFDSIQAGILLVDPGTHRVVEANSFALGMMGRRGEEVVGEVCHGLVCPAEVGRCPLTDLGQKLDVSERALLGYGGREIPILKSATTIRRGGRELILESFIDISRQHEAQAALRRAHDQLEEKVAERTRELETANLGLKELDRQKSTFLSSASHELRTPLTSVLGFAKLMHKVFRRTFQPLAAGDPGLEEKAREFSANFEIIHHEGERLTRLINDLLDLNRIESGRMQWRDVSLDLSAFLARMARAAEGLFAAPDRVALRSDIPGTLGNLTIDPDRLEQVLFNLLHNAAKFTSEGHVRLAATRDDGAVEIRVEDTGPGIAEADISRIFERFYQANEPNECEAPVAKPLGTGLGLAICRQIVEHYGGTIRAESRPGCGSAFIIRLPRPVAAYMA